MDRRTMKLKTKTLNAFIRKHREHKSLKGLILTDLDDNPCIASSLDALSPIPYDMYKSEGLYLEGEYINFPTDLSGCEKISKQIWDAYNDEAKDKEAPTWTSLDLGGDDDVDYNSSYVDMAIETCKLYLKLGEHTNEI
tara:strand:+ start:4750 stop:5163 length:414 start_codon:yes stop_codon:yes gene_type:complete